ncbi:hypothetical protein SCHPADRAFT_875306 [Schizopora paradoxa]|uniref:SnoaL-like domain-containing protein n=1 Tax=Schizopora paradoxa TaxID=27342 RepID=A0A0H2RLT4_9AGAM|nr:hypothetical protein SCHPADRAFT_875306 [Schizopora paradoxa]
MSSTHHPDLETWVKQKLESLYLNKVDGDFDAYFDSVFAPDVQLTVNDEPVDREQFKTDLKNFQFAATSGSVDWEHVEVKPKDETKPDEAGTVAGQDIVTRSLRIRIRVSQMQTQRKSSFEAEVETLASPAGDQSDKRRIVKLSEKREDHRLPVNIRGVVHPSD